MAFFRLMRANVEISPDKSNQVVLGPVGVDGYGLGSEVRFRVRGTVSVKIKNLHLTMFSALWYNWRQH